MKYLGMDYGSKTLGISISDETGVFASPYKTLFYKNNEELIKEVEKIVNEEKIDEIVLGNPLNLDGSLSDRSKETLLFKSELEKLNLKINLWDERLTTVEAEKILLNNNTKKKKKKNIIDTVAAVIILQSYLDRKEKNGRS